MRLLCRLLGQKVWELASVLIMSHLKLIKIYHYVDETQDKPEFHSFEFYAVDAEQTDEEIKQNIRSAQDLYREHLDWFKQEEPKRVADLFPLTCDKKYDKMTVGEYKKLIEENQKQHLVYQSNLLRFKKFPNFLAEFGIYELDHYPRPTEVDIFWGSEADIYGLDF